MPPLAQRMRPQILEDILGQDHLIGEHSVLRQSLQQGIISSLLFWGPPGTGKTTLAQVIASQLDLPFYSLSAVTAGVKDLREIITRAEKFNQQTILFIDEIHRFNKSQQDALLHAVELGTVVLIGATTENPSFEVNSALLSRSHVYILKSLEEQDLIMLLHKAINHDELLTQYTIHLEEISALIKLSGGDARKLLNLLEIIVTSQDKSISLHITDEMVMRVAQQHIALYDKSGEQHYDIISAFIKSIRGSDPNAAVYWLARMLAGGEDIRFIARRMIIAASEDIGNANPNALVLATSVFDAVAKVGNPESRIILSQCAIYLATSLKSNASYKAINEAQSLIKETGNLPVPLHLRNAPTQLMKDQDYGKDYRYSHDYDNNFSSQEYFPDKLSGTTLFHPGDNPQEQKIKEHLQQLRGGKYKQ